MDAKFDAAIGTNLDQDSKEPGYKEFLAQFAALSAIITDRKQRTAAALAAVQAANPRLDATQIAKSLGERLKLLSSYEGSYEEDAKKRQEEETAGKTRAANDARSRIQELDAEIGRLQGERGAVAAEIERLEAGLSGVTAKYDGYRALFQSAVEARREEIRQLMNFVAPGAAK